MGYSALIVYGLMGLGGLLAGRIIYIADARAKKKRREKRIPMKWQESKEYQ